MPGASLGYDLQRVGVGQGVVCSRGSLRLEKYFLDVTQRVEPHFVASFHRGLDVFTNLFEKVHDDFSFQFSVFSFQFF